MNNRKYKRILITRLSNGNLILCKEYYDRKGRLFNYITNEEVNFSNAVEHVLDKIFYFWKY